MNPLAILTPNTRATPAHFFVGLVVLFLLDGVKTWYGMTLDPAGAGQMYGNISLALSLAMIVFVSFLFINRRRDAGEGVMLFLLPVIIAVVVSGLGFLIMVAAGTIGMMGEYADSVGVNLQAALEDPGFQAEFQSWLEERPERALDMVRPAVWGGFGGFWILTGLFGLWFMSMKSE